MNRRTADSGNLNSGPVLATSCQTPPGTSTRDRGPRLFLARERATACARHARARRHARRAWDAHLALANLTVR